MLDKLDVTQLQDIIKSCPIGMMLLDGNGKVTWLNAALQDMLGERAGQLLGKGKTEVSDAELQQLFELNSTLHLTVSEEQDDLWLLGSTQDLSDDTMVQYFVDITPLHWLMDERDQLKAELEDIIMVDQETGMRNRKGLYYSLEPQLSRSRRYNRPLSVIIMRLDCVERYLQELDTDSAKPLLIAVSQLLNDQLRWADIIGRLNDTDFLLVLPETHADDARKVINNMQEKLQHLSIDNDSSKPFEITARFGVAEWRKGDDMGLLLMRARGMLNGDASPQPAAAG